MIGSLRGFSAVIYGLQHDTNPPHIREQDGGIPQSTIQLGLTGAPPFGPKCKLEQGNRDTFFRRTPAPLRNSSVNLAACLFADEEALLKSTTLIPTTAFSVDSPYLVGDVAGPGRGQAHQSAEWRRPQHRLGGVSGCAHATRSVRHAACRNDVRVAPDLQERASGPIEGVSVRSKRADLPIDAYDGF